MYDSCLSHQHHSNYTVSFTVFGVREKLRVHLETQQEKNVDEDFMLRNNLLFREFSQSESRFGEITKLSRHCPPEETFKQQLSNHGSLFKDSYLGVRGIFYDNPIGSIISAKLFFFLTSIQCYFIIQLNISCGLWEKIRGR